MIWDIQDDHGTIIANVYATEDGKVELDAADLPLTMSTQTSDRLRRTLELAAVRVITNRVERSG